MIGSGGTRRSAIVVLIAGGCVVSCMRPRAEPLPPPPPSPEAPAPQPGADRGVLRPDLPVAECRDGTQRELRGLLRCDAVCSNYGIQVERCEGSRWTRQPDVGPACACTPREVPEVLRACNARAILLTPSPGAPNDGCKLTLGCAESELVVECDGENDGTGTSLCDCHRDGVQVRGLRSDPWPGEGIDTCYAAAAACATAQ